MGCVRASPEQGPGRLLPSDGVGAAAAARLPSSCDSRAAAAPLATPAARNAVAERSFDGNAGERPPRGEHRLDDLPRDGRADEQRQDIRARPAETVGALLRGAPRARADVALEGTRDKLPKDRPRLVIAPSARWRRDPVSELREAGAPCPRDGRQARQPPRAASGPSRTCLPLPILA